MGCSGCKLVKQLKREPYTEEVVGVDVDGVELNMCRWVTQPLTTDFLTPRARPLTVRLMQGTLNPNIVPTFIQQPGTTGLVSLPCNINAHILPYQAQLLQQMRDWLTLTCWHVWRCKLVVWCLMCSNVSSPTSSGLSIWIHLSLPRSLRLCSAFCSPRQWW